MGYITSERVKEIRNELKTLFPAFKFSITREHYSTVHIAIIEAPFSMTEKEYETVNIYHISSRENSPAKDVLEKVLSIAQSGVKYYETGDYGTQPSFYVDITIGKWDKPFKLKK